MTTTIRLSCSEYQFDISTVVEHEVLRLEVPVDDTLDGVKFEMWVGTVGTVGR